MVQTRMWPVRVHWCSLNLLSVDYYSKWIEVARLDDIPIAILSVTWRINLQGTVSLMNLSATMAPSTHVQHSTILAGVMVLCTRPQVLCICSQMVKWKEPCKPLRISSVTCLKTMNTYLFPELWTVTRFVFFLNVVVSICPKPLEHTT